MADQKMTEYERRRLENIKRNDEMLAALKIQSRIKDLSTVNKRQRTESKSYKKSPTKNSKPETPVVLRRSLRTRGVPPDAISASGLKDDYDETRVRKIPKLNSSPVKKVSPRERGPLAMRDAYTSDDASNQKLIQTMSGFSKKFQLRESNGFPCDLVKGVEKSEDFEAPKVRKRASGSVDAEALKLEPKNIARVVPGRIMNVRFFPTADVPMVAVGNKFGNIGFWKVDAENDNGDGIYLYCPHSGPVSGIVLDPFSVSKMFSSCYDGFIRLMDVEKEAFDLVYSSEYSIHSISQSPHDRKSLYFSEGHGGVNMWDLKAGKSLSLWNLHDNRINTIDFNSENSNIMATSSTDGTACIWDLRHMSADKSKSLKTVCHKRAVHSAYFSPSGRFLATTSIDNQVALSTGENYEDMSMVYHNNQTGRWLSTFRGIWGWDDSSVFVGNMKRGVDIISVAGKKIVSTLYSELMSAIPCRFDAHPYKVGMLAGATSGGQVYIWSL
ncbi:DROUGHT SENSITIVE 1 [Forsythia ovata]|uniref:WD repeat-containing protein 76 n=1 Tax=Forsythia ovata TaxID=205694 RepID=A0ABD1R6F3_9LAMI